MNQNAFLKNRTSKRLTEKVKEKKTLGVILLFKTI